MNLRGLVTAILFLAAPFLYAEEDADRQRLTELSRQIARSVEALRGWEFEGEIKTDFIPKAELIVWLKKKLDEEYPDERLKPDEAFLKMIGVFPEHVDLKGALIEILGSQVAGFYEPKDKTFYIVTEVANRYGPLPLAVVIAHELTHALDDEKLDLDALIKGANKDLDREFAVASVVEGSATALMNRYLLGELEKQGGAVFGLVLFSAVSMIQDREAMEALLEAPRYFHTIVAPYTLGEAFLSYKVRGEAEGSDAAKEAAAVMASAKDIPLSSEQILHPRKYWDVEHRDEPDMIDSSHFRDLLNRAGLTAVHEQTGGEMLCALATEESRDPAAALMSGQWTNAAATGWGGDRFYLVERNGSRGGVWATTWDTPEDREEFLAAYERVRGVGQLDVIRSGERSAVLLFGIDADTREAIRRVLSEHAPRFTRAQR